jgi:hypothetical protein
MRRKAILLSAVMGLLTCSAFAQNPAGGPGGQNMRVRGTVDSLNGQTLVVKTMDGQSVSVTLAPDLVIIANAKASLADIKPGDFVGSGAVKGPDGKLHAQEVHIFAESMRGTGEGQRAMGGPAPATTTNATVAAVAPQERSMTNATVTSNSGGTLKLQYKGGEAEIEVAPDTPIVRFVVGDTSLLKPGSTVSVNAMKTDAGLVAHMLTAEKDGVKAF